MMLKPDNGHGESGAQIGGAQLFSQLLYNTTATAASFSLVH